MGEGTVVVCDALRAVAEALSGCLAADTELIVVATVTSAEELLEAVAMRRPGLALVGAEVARGREPSLAADVRQTWPGCRILMTGPVTASDEAAAALRDGVMGWLPDESTAPEMVEAARGVLRGEYRLPPSLLADVLQTFARQDFSQAEDAVVGGDPRLAALGDRELTVLACLVSGLERREIAVRLGIAENTVRTHVGRILGKLGAHSMLEAAAIGRRAGLAGLDD